MLKQVLTLREAAALLGWRSTSVRLAIEVGIRLPKSGRRQHLAATRISENFEILREHLDEFLTAFEQEEPGRHPPVGVRQQLLVDSGHRCAICGLVAPLQFHHIIEFSELRHHDPEHMLAVCGVCHDRIGLGEIDAVSQRATTLLFDNLRAIQRYRGDAFVREMLVALVRDKEVDVFSAAMSFLGLFSLCGVSMLVTERGLIEALFVKDRAGALEGCVLEGLLETLGMGFASERGFGEATVLIQAYGVMTDDERHEVLALLDEGSCPRGDLLLALFR